MITNDWEYNLKIVLEDNMSKNKAGFLFKKYQYTFCVKYKKRFSPKHAMYDICAIEEIYSTNKDSFKVYNSKKNTHTFIQFKIFSFFNRLSLSIVFSMIDNLGLSIINRTIFELKVNNLGLQQKTLVYYFKTKSKFQVLLPHYHAAINLKKGLEKIWNKVVENDTFNSLIYHVGINYREANLLRAYAKYIRQIKDDINLHYIPDILIKNSEITRLLVKLFHIRFNPLLSREQVVEASTLKNLKSNLIKISILIENKILNNFLSFISATKRTNFFLTDRKTKNLKEYISLKFSLKEIKDIHIPKPEIDIFVYSSKFEGVHLRGAKIARGGLRWSDTTEDLRKVVLELMQAQVTKNSLIIPSGSKGAFAIKNCKVNNHNALDQVIECYKNFLRGILDITDNIVNTKIVTPLDVIRHDSDDPYFVIAADKGTATFSDYANEVAKEYNFWLGDAFASGGSNGYNHKKIGITAKGAWISIKDHFNSLNIDIDKEILTVIGIGDMSGDVFGNGMLLSKKVKLLAAFNHNYIFLDPNPDPYKSFKERQKLFNNPKLNWSHYSKNLISQGGGIHKRSVKKISITPEVKNALSINMDILTPSELISTILKSPVDLLWNGGIGTYIKGECEKNNQIADRKNDNLRILGKDLRCKVACEGGNLGFTQKGRIEFAKSGGKINTDFIDNAGGVNCSDHEVNIKIALQQELLQKNITLQERNMIIHSSSTAVENIVLEDSYRQLTVLSIENYSNINNLYDYSRLISYLEKIGDLNREVEKVASKEEIIKLEIEKKSLTRPEIAVLIAYVKNTIAKTLSTFNFTEDKFFQKILILYFPANIQRIVKTSLLLHQLNNQIITTMVANEFVNTLGCTIFHTLSQEQGFDPVVIIKSFYIMMVSTDAKNTLKIINSVPITIRYKLYRQCIISLQSALNSILEEYTNINKIGRIIINHTREFNIFCNTVSSKKFFKNTALKKQIKKIYSYIQKSKNTKSLLLKIYYIILMDDFYNIQMVNQSYKLNFSLVTKIYFKIKNYLYIDQILELINEECDFYYMKGLAHKLRNDLSKITINIVSMYLKNFQNTDIFTFLSHNKNLVNFNKCIIQIYKNNHSDNLIVVQIIINRLQEYLTIGRV